MQKQITTTHAYIMAAIFNECLTLGINPHQATDPMTCSPVNFNALIAKAETQLLNNNYIALYFNRDVPEIAIEASTSQQDLIKQYHGTNPDLSYNILLNGNSYTIDIIEDI